MTLYYLLLGTYTLPLCILLGFALHRLWLAWASRQLPLLDAPEVAVDEAAWPPVLVQLPMYNESTVAARAIAAACGLRYPRDRLHIQVLDDSTDGTCAVVDAAVLNAKARGHSISVIRRRQRRDFKAGALQAGLASSSAPFVAIFDADFIPPANFLYRIMWHFRDADVGMVQARWTHLNRDASWLTQAQAMLLDGHFVHEHGGRFMRGRWFNFNGTCGVWRRACIDDAGGWLGRTLTEDLDLSYRAQLRGWRFVYKPSLTVPGELPADGNAFKAQQYRWAKGAVETARWVLPTIWKSQRSWGQKLEASVHLLGNAAYPCALLLALALPLHVVFAPTSWWNAFHVVAGEALIALIAGLALVVFYASASQRCGVKVWVWLPATLAIGAGLAVNNTRALFAAALGRSSPFVRTPKTGDAVAPTYCVEVGAQTWVELILGLYLVAAIIWALVVQRYLVVPLLLLFAMGFMLLAWDSWRAHSQAVRLVSDRGNGKVCGSVASS